MTETLTFPGLGWSVDLNPIIFQITDTWAVRWYGVILMFGFLFGCLYALRRARSFGLDPDRVLDVLMGGVIGGILGARFYYVLFDGLEKYADDPLRVFRIWEGGLALYGGVIGGVLVGLILCKKRGVAQKPMLDLAAAGILLGQAIGRWGNFVNMEAFGKNTDLPWGMISPTITRYLQYRQPILAAEGIFVDPNMPVHPTFFYESVWCLIGFILIAWYTGRRRYDGELAIFYIGWYGLGRAWIEGLRTDSLMWGSIRVSQALAIACVLVAAGLLLRRHGQLKRGEVEPLFVHSELGCAVASGLSYEEAVAQQQGGARSTRISKRAAAKRRENARLCGRKKMAAVRMAHREPGIRTRGLRR